MKRLFLMSSFIFMFYAMFFQIRTYAKDFEDSGKVVITKGNKTVLYSKWTIGRKKNFLKDYHIVTIKSGNPKVAKVNRYGVITAKKVGKTQITLVGYKDINHKYKRKHTWNIVVKKKIDIKDQYRYSIKDYNGSKGIVLKEYIGYDSIIKIPNKINGIPVLGIGKECFGKNLGEEVIQGSYVEKSISMGNNIRYIDDYAFSCCTNLKSVKLSTNLEKIGRGIFAFSSVANTNIEAIYQLGIVPDETFQAVPVINQKYFKLDIPQNVKSIGERAFADTKIEKISLHEGLENIGDGAFDNTGKYDMNDNTYQTLMIPSTVKTIGNQAFQCETLTEVVINSFDVDIANDAFLTKISRNHVGTGTNDFKTISYSIPLIIYGKKDSTAETWAKQAKATFKENSDK